MPNPTTPTDQPREETARTRPTARPISDREFVLEHEFTARADQVFAAYTDPHLIAQWWVPTGGVLRVESMDPRPGGAWRFVQPMPNGQEITYRGSYLEVRPPTRLAYTFEIEGQAGSELTATIDLEEVHGTTRLKLTNLCASQEARDAMVKYGAAAGARAAWTRLGGVLSRA